MGPAPRQLDGKCVAEGLAPCVGNDNAPPRADEPACEPGVCRRDDGDAVRARQGAWRADRRDQPRHRQAGDCDDHRQRRDDAHRCTAATGAPGHDDEGDRGRHDDRLHDDAPQPRRGEARGSGRDPPVPPRQHEAAQDVEGQAHDRIGGKGDRKGGHLRADRGVCGRQESCSTQREEDRRRDDPHTDARDADQQSRACVGHISNVPPPRHRAPGNRATPWPAPGRASRARPPRP